MAPASTHLAGAAPTRPQVCLPELPRTLKGAFDRKALEEMPPPPRTRRAACANRSTAAAAYVHGQGRRFDNAAADGGVTCATPAERASEDEGMTALWMPPFYAQASMLAPLLRGPVRTLEGPRAQAVEEGAGVGASAALDDGPTRKMVVEHDATEPAVRRAVELEEEGRWWWWWCAR